MSESNQNPKKGSARFTRTPEQIAQRQAPAQAARASQQAHMDRVRQVLPRKGSRPGGMREVMNDPNYQQRSMENTQRRQQEAQEARNKVGVQTPHRAASSGNNADAFAAGRDHKKLSIGANPNIEARRSRFDKK